ncbi:hypothetical protein D9M70_468900 [compost metagenome]
MDHVGGQLADAHAGAHRFHLGLHVVEAGDGGHLLVDQRAVDLQLPRYHAPGRRAAEAGALVLQQFVQRGRLAVPRQVAGRGADDQRQLAQPARHQVLAWAGAGAEADIDAGLDQVGEEVAQHHIEGDARMQFAEGPHQRHQHAAADRRRRGQADQAVVIALAAAHLVQRLIQLAHAGCGQFKQARALGGEAELARGPVQQAHAEVVFQRTHRLADGLRGHAGLHRGALETAGAHHADEEGEDAGLVHDWQLAVGDVAIIVRNRAGLLPLPQAGEGSKHGGRQLALGAMVGETPA